MSRQTLTHCGKYSDQNQEADFHLELAQSAKWQCEKEKKIKQKSSIQHPSRLFQFKKKKKKQKTIWERVILP